MLDIYTKKREVLIKYLGCLNRHLWRQVTLFKPRTINEACVQAQYMENMGMTKGQPSGSKKKGNQVASKEKKSGKERIRTQQPLQINARIQITVSTIVI